MSNNSGGSAATALPPGVRRGWQASGEHNASPPEISPDYHSAYFMGTNAVCPDGIHMSAVSTFARNISRDDRSTDGTRYDSVLRTVRIHPHGLHELLASSRVRSLPYDLAGLAKVDTLRYQEHRKLPNVQLETDFVRLHHITKGLPKAPRYVVCQVVPAQIREKENWDLAQQVVMVSDRSVHEAHFSSTHASKPRCTPISHPANESKAAEAFIGIATVFTFLHGIDALQRRPERARVTMPLAHLDLIIRLSMEPVPGRRIIEPNILSENFNFIFASSINFSRCTLPSRPVLQIQPHNRDQVHTLFIDSMDHFDMRPRNSDTEPDPIRMHINDAMVDLPVSTALCERIAIAAAEATAIASNSHEASTAPIIFPAIVSPAPIIQAARENALDAISPGSQLQTGQQLSIRAEVTSNPASALVNGTERNIPTRTTATGTAAPKPSQSLLSEPAQLLSAQLDRISNIAPESAETAVNASEGNQPIASRSSPDVSLIDPSARRYTEPGRDPGSKKIRTDNRGIQVPSETLPEQRPRANSLPNPFERLSLEDAPTITPNVDLDIRPNQQNSASEPYELEEGEIREDEEMAYWDGITGPQSSGENSSMQGTAPASRTASERRRDFSGDSSGGDEPRFIATNPVPVPTIYNNLPPPGLPPLPAPRPVAQVHAVFTDLQRSPLPPNPAPDIP
ncbi:hypothetical protein C8J56DRAFT_1060962 [Mycena floridula]|nr:hypothetical protein C8J56DRAFT_1060962 [Mycena floridula]